MLQEDDGDEDFEPPLVDEEEEGEEAGVRRRNIQARELNDLMRDAYTQVTPWPPTCRAFLDCNFSQRLQFRPVRPGEGACSSYTYRKIRCTIPHDLHLHGRNRMEGATTVDLIAVERGWIDIVFVRKCVTGARTE